MTGSPKLSIGLPVRNGAKYVRRAIESVLSQAFPDFELIISDNASTDDTPAICQEYARRDARVRYVRQPHDLSLGNFYYVFSHARGDYFMWLAADDWWRGAFLERATTILDNDPGVVMVFSHFEIYNWTTDEYGPRAYVIPSHGSPQMRLLVRLLNPVANAFYGMMRRAAVDLSALPPIDFSDILFLNHMALKGDIAVIGEHLFVAGRKASAPAVNRSRLRFLPYYRHTSRLIRRNFRGIDKCLLWLVLSRQVVGFYKAYGHRSSDRCPPPPLTPRLG